jgi:hypothetical protein
VQSVFAQDPLFDSAGATAPGANYTPLAAAAARPHVAAIGSAPYVERTRAQALQNIELVLALAAQHARLPDFHLDYTLDPAPPLIHALLSTLHAHAWPADKPLALGHCTRLSLFGPGDFAALHTAIGALPIGLVALPQSDVYMMRAPGGPRGTLPVPAAARAGLLVAAAVNNVGNAFTPQGSTDPLALCPLGVALYQDATPDACRTLLVRHWPCPCPCLSLFSVPALTRICNAEERDDRLARRHRPWRARCGRTRARGRRGGSGAAARLRVRACCSTQPTLRAHDDSRGARRRRPARDELGRARAGGQVCGGMACDGRSWDSVSGACAEVVRGGVGYASTWLFDCRAMSVCGM